MKKYHPLSFTGLIIGTLAGIFFWAFLISEMINNIIGTPIVFVGLLILVMVAVIAGWAKPLVAPLLMLCAGVMLATYSATTSGRYDLFVSLSLGVPLIVAAVFVAIGNKLLAISKESGFQ